MLVGSMSPGANLSCRGTCWEGALGEPSPDRSSIGGVPIADRFRGGCLPIGDRWRWDLSWGESIAVPPPVPPALSVLVLVLRALRVCLSCCCCLYLTKDAALSLSKRSLVCAGVSDFLFLGGFLLKGYLFQHLPQGVLWVHQRSN